MRRSREEILAEKKMQAERREQRDAARLASCKDRFGAPCTEGCQRGCAKAKAEREKAAARTEQKRAAELADRQSSDQRVKERLAPVQTKRSKDLTASERALLRIAKLEKAKAKEMKLAGIEYDPRTAAGQREYDIRSLGGTKGARVDRFNNLFRNRGEATKARIVACEEFDKLCHIAGGGLYPTPRFEPRVDTSGIGGFADDRAAGLETLANLKAKIGDDFHAIMTARVHMSMTYTAMESAGYGDRNALSSLFVAAVDAVARYFRIGGRSPLIEAAEAVFKRA